MVDYMAELEKTVGCERLKSQYMKQFHESLKSQYMKQFPSLSQGPENVIDDFNGEDDTVDVLPSNPMERRDARISELKKSVAIVPELQEKLLKMKAELHLAVKSSNVAKNKLKFARKVTEERLKECLPVPNFEDDYSKVLITLMSTLIDEDSFSLDPETDLLKPKEDFLKDIEDSLTKDSDEVIVKERLNFVKK